MTKKKTYTGWLIINWRDDDVRFRKTKPSKSDRSPAEYPVKVSVEATVPDVDIPEIAAELNVPTPQVREVVYSDLLNGDQPDGPPWHDDVDAALDDHSGLVEQYETGDMERDTLVDTVVGATLRRVDGYPDTADVEQRVDDRVRALTADDTY